MTTERRPHWDDDLVDGVGRRLIPLYRSIGYCTDAERHRIYALIEFIEDWHKAKRDSRIRTHSEGCWRWHNECAEALIEYQQAAIHHGERLSRIKPRDIYRALDGEQ